MKTISTAYYEKMAEAKQTFCAFCMRGAMPFLEDCKDCKINRMFKAVQAVIKEETTPQDEAAVEKTRNAYDAIDLPKEMIESLGRGREIMMVSAQAQHSSSLSPMALTQTWRYS